MNLHDAGGTVAVPQETERIASQIVDAGLRVHEALGPGLLESTYEHCLAHELALRGLTVQRQVQMPISYRGTTLDAGYRLDLFVDACVIVEVKAIELIQPIHQAQLLTYLRLADCRVGFLMNFNVLLFKSGIRRVVLLRNKEEIRRLNHEEHEELGE